MLEKNKDYLEMRVSSTDCAFTQNAATQISVDGYVYTPYMDLPTPGEFYILISKEKFEKLQTENEQLKKKLQVPDPFAEYKELLEKLHSKEDVEKFEWTLNHICGGQASANGWMVTAKLWRRNYETLSKLVGFSSTEEIQDYLTNEAECDTLQEAIASLEHNVKFARDERRDLSKKLEECEKDYISERDKAEALQTENKQLKKKLGEFDFMGWMASAKFWKDQYEDLFKLVGFSYVKEIQDYLTNEAECDTLQEAVSKLKDQVEYTCDEWYSADSIHQWQKVTGYDNPKDFLKWKANIEGIVEAWKSETGCKYPGDARRLLEKWQKATGCDTPGRAEEKFKFYKERLGKAIQAASCAAKHLENIMCPKEV